MGFQWFPIPWIDGSSEEEAMAGMARAVEDLDAFLDALMVDEDLLPEQVVLFGFSQGTMMSLHVAPRREDEVAGVVGFSGRLLGPELLAVEVISRPPILLVHGDQDDVVPPVSLPAAAEALQGAGWKEVAQLFGTTWPSHAYSLDFCGLFSSLSKKPKTLPLKCRKRARFISVQPFPQAYLLRIVSPE